MKALTNILTQLLMLLLLMLVACTEDAAEVDNLVRGEEYVQVRMQVPGMKAAATRATADDNITSIVALVFREDKLISKTEVTTAAYTLKPTSTTTGTFNLPRPKDGDVIHFLANLPEGYDLSSVDEMSDLTSLTTDNPSQLSYWGMATYNGGDVIDNVTLYRNMAKVEIAKGPNCTFPEDRLFIAGLVKPIEKGTLVPYKDGFNFNLNDNDYYTLPSSLNDPASRTNNQLLEPAKSLYIFEHDNPGTANGLYVICEIDEDYYKVALIDEKGEPYPIIRNHRYVIYVNDLDEGAERFDIAASPETKPYNFEVREYKDVTLTLLPSSVTLDYTKSNPSASKLSLTVGGIKNVVETLTFDAPGFTIQPGDGAAATAENGVFKITNTSKESIGFTFTLTDPDIVESISVTGAGKYVNNEITPASTTVTLKESITAEADKSQLYYDSNDAQEVTVNVTVPDGVETLNISAPDFSFDGDSDGNYTYAVSQTNISLKFTMKSGITEAKESTITFSGGESVNAKSVKIPLIKTPVVMFSPDESSKEMSINDTYTITMIVPNNDANNDELTALSIDAEGFTVTASTEGLSGSDGSYTYTGGTTQFTFTLTSADTDSRTIRFYNGEGVDINVPEKEISVTVGETAPSKVILISENNPVTIDWTPIQLPYADLDDYKGKTMYALVQISNEESRQIRFENHNYGGIAIFEQASLPANTETTLEVTIPSDLSNYMQIRGFGVTIKELYIIP